MITFEFKIDGLEVAKTGIKDFTEGVSDLTPAFEDVLDYLYASEGERFSSGDSWAPLSPQYAEWKAKHGGGGVLIYSGALMGSLSGGGGIAEVSPMRLVWGTDVPYAAYHQYGTSRMPARPPIEVTVENRQEIMRIVQRHLVEAARAGE